MSLASALPDTRGGEARSSRSLLKGLEKIVVPNGATALQPSALSLDPCIRTVFLGTPKLRSQGTVSPRDRVGFTGFFI